MNMKMMFARSVKGLPSTVFLILLMTRRLMTTSEIVVWADSNDDDVRKALRVLEGLQVARVDVRERGEKWFGLASGYQDMLPGMFDAIDAAESGYLPGPDKSDSGIFEQEKQARNMVFDAGNGAESDLSDSAFSSLESLDSKELKRLEESNYLDSGEAGSDFSEAEFVGKTTSEILCRESYRILGKAVRFDEKVKSRSMREILAWMAQGYQSRDDLMSPVGFVYRAICHELKKGNKVDANKLPDPQYLENPFVYLPYDYLDAVGLGEYHIQRCDRCGLMGGEHAAHCLNGAAVEFVRESVERMAVPVQTVWPETTESIAVAGVWSQCLMKLSEELPPSAFETWVKDAWMLGYQDGALTLAVRNLYARDWISMKLGDVVQRYFAERVDGFQGFEIVVETKGENDE